jgi:UDP-glucose 4-epimerase
VIKMNVLITGGAGFVGSHLADACLQRGYGTYVLDNLSTGRKENLSPGVELIIADIARDDLDDIVSKVKPEYIFHLAAQSSVPVSIRDPFLDAEVNIIGTIKLLEAARKNGVKKIIYASSAAVYGNPCYLPINETHQRVPLSFYGISKYVPEYYMKVYMDLYGLSFTALRYANIYGPRQIPHGEGGVIAIFVDRILKGEEIVIHGDGEQTRDFIYVTDIALANLAAMEHGDGGIYNIGTGVPTTINQLVSTLEEIVDAPIAKRYGPAREGDIRDSYFDSTPAINELNWKPQISLSEGLKKTFQFYR